MTNDDTIRHILTTTRRIALVGASNKPERPSYGVMAVPDRARVLTSRRSIPASRAGNPRPQSRRHPSTTPPRSTWWTSSATPTHVEAPVNDAIRLGAKTIWMQLGVINEAVAKTARDAGLQVVMDRCPAIDIPRLGLLK